MNIDQLYTVEDHEHGAEMQVRGPDGILLDMFVSLKGVDSKTFRKAYNQAKREILLGEDSAEAEAKVLAEVSTGWRGFNDKGEELIFTKELAIQLYINAPYLKEQVDQFIAKRKNFIQA